MNFFENVVNFGQLLKHVTISSGGVMPHIHRELLNEKSANAKKNTVLPTKNSAQRVAKVTSITSKRATKVSKFYVKF